jgi:Uma2 family endonuclease
MSAVLAQSPYISEMEYLESEVRSPFKREYLGGAVYAMAGASEPHNIIAMNLYAGLHTRLRGKSCQPFGSDMKLRLRPSDAAYYYYPDAMIACDPTDVGHGWRERPAALFEILSPDSRQVDEREKRLAYLQLASLQAYVRIEQERAEVIVEQRRPEGWRAERLSGLDAVVRLPSLEIELPLAELYERVKFGT